MTLATANPLRTSVNTGALDTTSDLPFSPPLRGIYVEVAGRFRATMLDGSVTDISELAVGWPPLKDISVVEAETTAVIHGFR